MPIGLAGTGQHAPRRNRVSLPASGASRLPFLVPSALRFCDENAASFVKRSSSAKVGVKQIRSTFMPSGQLRLEARLMASLATPPQVGDIEAIFFPRPTALLPAICRQARPRRRGRTLGFRRSHHPPGQAQVPSPSTCTARVRPLVPPMPVMCRSGFSGWPNFAVSEA